MINSVKKPLKLLVIDLMFFCFDFWSNDYSK